MRKISSLLFSILLFILLAVTSVKSAHAQVINTEPPEQVMKGVVEQILDQGMDRSFGMNNPYQKVKVKILDGADSGNEIVIDHGKGYSLDTSQLVYVGETVVINKISGPDGIAIYHITDKYRIDQLTTIIVVFFVAIVFLSGWQGLGSIVGMIFSLVIIAKFIVPLILSGYDPLLVSIVGCLIIMVATIYLAHGYSKKTTIALASTFITLVLTGVLATLFVKMTGLAGLGSDDAYSLRLGSTGNINLKGLLLGGILIGTLGVLDDVTTGLAASLFELAKANPKYTFKKLYSSGLVIGKEHITSLVNTLVLAYAGSSLPIFLILILNPSHYPLWSILNSEMIVEEIVRTLAGSIGLVAAVPLTTFLASVYLSEFYKPGKS